MKTVTIAYSGGYGVENVTIPGPFDTMAEVRGRNAELGHHYFERSTVRFFRSRPAKNTLMGRFFIDSIQFVGSNGVAAAREYKIVCVLDNGACESLVTKIPDNWNGKPKDNHSKDEEWGKETFASAREAKNALTYLLSRVPTLETKEVL